jgi:hypothetical protein
MPDSLPLDEPDFDALHLAQRNARRKALGLLAAGGALLFALLLWGFVADEAPPDLGDLRVPRQNLPDAENAYALLAKRLATLPPEPKDHTPEERHFSQIFDDKVAWNQEVVAAVQGRYPPELFADIHGALEAPASQAPEIRTFADLVPEVGRFRYTASILTRQASLQYHAGQHGEAAETNLLALKLGSRISQSRGVLITVLTGTAIEGIALAAIQKHADSPSIPPETLRSYLAQIGQYELRPEDYHTAYKAEVVPLANAVAQFKTLGASATLGTGKKSWEWLLAAPGLWQPNRTLRIYADQLRATIAGDDPTRPAGVISPAERVLSDYASAPWPRRAQNYTGREFLEAVGTSSGKISTTCHRVRANLRLTQIYLALRLYQIEHEGALPADLAALVPACLPTVPLDPFDGQPLRYDRALTTIWSTDRERRTISDADSELPRGMPACRLRFARAPVVLPAFAEESAP